MYNNPYISKSVGVSERIGESNIDKLIVDELSEEFNLAQYDLDESDILRAIKIESILAAYPHLFTKHYALKIFYSVAKAGAINAATLNEIVCRPNDEYKRLIDEFIHAGLFSLNEDKALTLTFEGKSLAEKIGVDIFFV